MKGMFTGMFYNAARIQLGFYNSLVIIYMKRNFINYILMNVAEMKFEQFRFSSLQFFKILFLNIYLPIWIKKIVMYNWPCTTNYFSC